LLSTAEEKEKEGLHGAHATTLQQTAGYKPLAAMKGAAGKNKRLFTSPTS
jgi:hypothetical protein